ncbi:STAS/SEC14 domain-containing protein [Flavobacterium sp. FBOR7N2.3]|uniref:STAS/SEC14 domain-containing protein n=1 Tax=Flavobacterium magnesitis TaxID=3138077 RepID=A0ABV4TIK6_9FLAO
MKENTIKKQCIEFWFENDILMSKFEKNTELDLTNIKEVIKIREEISRGEKQYWLYDLRNVKNMTKEARDYADQYGQDYLHAVAVLVNSHITKFIFNSYLKLKKPIMPFQVFADADKAIDWLLAVKVNMEKL